MFAFNVPVAPAENLSTEASPKVEISTRRAISRFALGLCVCRRGWRIAVKRHRMGGFKLAIIHFV